MPFWWGSTSSLKSRTTGQWMTVASHIPRKRFFGALHLPPLCTNIAARGQPEYDWFAKVCPVITALQKSFLEANNPHRENAIDEAMIKFKGRSSLKQYLPKKPIKRGFKVWVRADSHNGYLCNFEIYTGKEKSTEVNLGAKVVKKAIENTGGYEIPPVLWQIFFFGFSDGRSSGRRAVCLRHLLEWHITFTKNPKMSSISVHANQGPKNETSILAWLSRLAPFLIHKFESFVFECSIGFKWCFNNRDYSLFCH